MPVQAFGSLLSTKLHRYEWLHLDITMALLSLASYFSMSENTQTTVVLGAPLLNSSRQIPQGYKPLHDCSQRAKRKPAPPYHFSTVLETPLPTRSSCPKTVFSPSAEQFHLPYRNWYWHSLIPICAPSPITMMASGRLWQIARCRGARPGILLQMILAPKATTDDKALKKKSRKTRYNQIEAIDCFCHVLPCDRQGTGQKGKGWKLGSYNYANLSQPLWSGKRGLKSCSNSWSDLCQKQQRNGILALLLPVLHRAISWWDVESKTYLKAKK